MQPQLKWVVSFFHSVIDTLLGVVSLIHVLADKTVVLLRGLRSCCSSMAWFLPFGLEDRVPSGRELPATSEMGFLDKVPTTSRCKSALGVLSQLPEDLVMQVAQSCSLCDLAALCRVSSVGHQQIWQQPGLWRGLAERAGIDATPCFTISHMPGVATREAFRHCTYKLDMYQMQTLSSAAQNAGGDLVKVLKTCAFIASGMMPADDIDLVESLIGAAEQALQVHDPTKKEPSEAAEELLATTKRRFDVFSWLQRERLNCARANAEQLHATMDDLVEKTPGSLAHASDATDWHYESFLDEGDNSAWTLSVVDEQKLQDLCARFEDL